MAVSFELGPSDRYRHGVGISIALISITRIGFNSGATQECLTSHTGIHFLVLYFAIPVNLFLVLFILSYFPSCAKSYARYKVRGRELL